MRSPMNPLMAGLSRQPAANRLFTTLNTRPVSGGIESGLSGYSPRQQARRNNSNNSRSRPLSTLSTGGLALLLLLPPTFYVLGSIYPPATLSLLFPTKAAAPLDRNTAEAKVYTDELEAKIQSLDLVSEMRSKAQPHSDWYETRPAAKPMHDHSLTSSVLRGPSLLAVPPIAFVKNDESEAIIILHLGRSLCGHDGIVHGGLIATVFDEALGRNALLNIPSNIGVTANLKLSYKKPTKADQFVVIRTKLDSVQGRKVNVSGVMEDLQGQALATASAMFVEPSYAKYLSNSGVAKALGKRPEILDTGGRLKDERKIPA